MPPLSRRLLAEALGTGLLVATVVGLGSMAERLAGGNQASSTSLANPAVTPARGFTTSYAGIVLADVPAFVARI
jgi:glycerol uptake facilitator-like aquaporin